ncbi:MAG TPA: hypothetical protein VE397_15360 [Stellaceae bacterium]|jgi:hypothetical protein|nr:hypothetical protein [Stellaceae bacterium]
MAFLFGVITFILGSVLVAVCLVAIPGPKGETPETPGGHGSGGHH